ncbi:dihydroxyacetone kinase subunit DhaL [Phytoactinopolyspora halotolerans]|uniref:Dihydroxyacetone kinase subunit L n=1 Tax=Phytoactinopolyspora halotolerans TaxID=1981512 RepID=A0A6L9SGI4_9ACTN|nr:dihydroxyacetone kinase subunit DhaL [Phytoactinopolyspora halotolerans]NEE03698.1 dihydroxyacetone kinase subunit L [Phytoactinopolyspora halotolerans]
MRVMTVEDVRRMLLAVAERIVASQNLLCAADRAIGDGDHGLGMRRGFTAAAERLEGDGFDDAFVPFRSVGDCLISTMGGASGVLFGVLFRGDVEAESSHTLSLDELTRHFERSLAEVCRRGRAQTGDKTLVDALEPAVRSLRQSADSGEVGLASALRAAASAARSGAEATKGYVARFGKARTLGERALGFVDPGALSTAIVFEAMADWAEDHDGQGRRRDPATSSTDA